MLERIYIQNFQSHLNTTIEFGPGLNLITGTTDHGKSSIIRGVRWVISNRLKKGPKLYRSHLAEASEAMSVRFIFSDGTDIERHSSPGMNAYILGNDYENPLKALRSDIPQEVLSALRMNAVNIEGQHDDYFLLEETPGQVATEFNNVVGLEEMDECMSESTSEVDSSKSGLKIAKAKLEGLTEQLQSLDWVTEAIPQLESLQTLEDRRTELELKIPEVERLVDEIFILQTLVQQTEDFIALDSKLCALENLDKRISYLEVLLTSIDSVQIDLNDCNGFLKIEDEYQELKKINIKKKLLDRDITNVSTLVQNIEILQDKLESLNDIDIQDTELTALENLQTLITKKSQRINSIETLIRSVDSLYQKIQDTELEIKNDEEIFHESLGAYETCPLCGYQIPGNEG